MHVDDYNANERLSPVASTAASASSQAKAKADDAKEVSHAQFGYETEKINAATTKEVQNDKQSAAIPAKEAQVSPTFLFILMMI